MLKEYPQFKRGEIQTIREKFPKATKDFLKEYFNYRKATGLKDLSNLERYVCHIRHIIQKPFNEFEEYNNHVQLVNIIKDSSLSNGVKFNILIDLNNLFEYVFPVMWKRENKFRELYIGKKGKKKLIFVKPAFNESDLPTNEEINKILQSENNLSWKTFILLLAGTGARQAEIRFIENKNIKFDSDGTSRIEIWMTKVDKSKNVFPDVKTTNYIQKLQEELKNSDKFGKYLFPSIYKKDGSPMTRSNVCDRIGDLSEKAIGRRITPHKFRHKKATEYYILVKEGKISEDTALKLLGHGKSMMDIYDHTPKEEEIAILKKQSFNPEIPKDERDKLEKKIEALEKSNIEVKQTLIDSEISNKIATLREQLIYKLMTGEITQLKFKSEYKQIQDSLKGSIKLKDIEA